MNPQRKLEIEELLKAGINTAGGLKVATLMERSIYNRAIAMARVRNIPQFWSEPLFVEQYSNIGYAVKMNLDPRSSINKGADSHLLKAIRAWVAAQILVGKPEPLNTLGIFFAAAAVDPKKVAELGPTELNPEANRAYLEELALRAQQQVEVKYVTRHRCRRCGERKTQEYEINSRRGDEGGTLHIICMSCSHRWRING